MSLEKDFESTLQEADQSVARDIQLYLERDFERTLQEADQIAAGDIQLYPERDFERSIQKADQVINHNSQSRIKPQTWPHKPRFKY